MLCPTVSVVLLSLRFISVYLKSSSYANWVYGTGKGHDINGSNGINGPNGTEVTVIYRSSCVIRQTSGICDG